MRPDDMTSVEIVRGQKLPQDDLLRQLVTLGYSIEAITDRPGAASRRGGIVDVHAPDGDAPVRIEWLGDELESLREFDPTTQRSLRTIERAAFGPAGEGLLAFTSEAIGSLRRSLNTASLNPEATERVESELSVLGSRGEADTFWLPFLLQATLFDHIPENALLIVDERAECGSSLRDAEVAAALARDEREQLGELPGGLPLPFAAWDDVEAAIERQARRIELARWATGEGNGSIRLDFGQAPAFGGQLRSLVSGVAAEARSGDAVVVVSQQAPRIRELFQEVGIAAQAEITAPSAGSVAVASGIVSGGWSYQLEGRRLLLISDAETFGFRKQRRLLPERRERVASTLLSEIEPGEYVVHIEHGIARFEGLVRRTSDGREREYMELRYAEGDRLFVPIDQIARVSRYVGPSERPPSLTRLGGAEWSRTTARVRRAVMDLAKDLLDLYAAREVAEGHAFSPDTPWQQELEASFPYVETPDQMDAIRATKADMERLTPMDRLVCGDVGYGKTEVAVRAAFKAVMDGMQVAVLVPTTVLAQQHYETFSERCAGFPVRIEMLSRFRSEREQRRILAEMAEGSVDIVIGTHRLLQKDVAFKNLGLVIIDEEQRFGVMHKERLKRMRREVDVLTLTATPIPRTLHMALAGIRDMSTIDTPPEARQPIRTYVAEYDERLVREAVRRELERGGQVYFVHNRVRNIEHIAEKLRATVPEARIVVGHGQMAEGELERVMHVFAEGEADVLVCTTIIESGIDIANVNTMVVNHADQLGLAQLYQLRGRIGRSARRAYAYLLYEKGKVLSEVARKRLQAVFEANELSAGFRIAMRDLEIRGAGNLLGAEQSGHVGAVGFDLYTRMLAEAVGRLKALRAGKPEPPPRPSTEVSIDLPLVAYLPESYVPELAVRLALYQRMADVRTPDEAANLAREMRDRFGPLPPAAQQLLYAAGLRAAAMEAGVESIARSDDVLVLKLSQDTLDRLSPGQRLGIERALPRG
ncbi:MAG TPA: transcription-repair coupling factor, partial [Dehalococcoidia bacterium]|nr:transcription-repair coupling factor [Dehalococcoidia bacterium]